MAGFFIIRKPVKAIRRVLFRILGQYSYLRLVSCLYLLITRLNLNKRKYPELHHLKNIIRDGFVCIDIGANLGYYAVSLSRLSGKSGKVYAVEPVELFQRVLRRNLKCYALQNVVVMPYALGAEHTWVSMSTPTINGIFRHGLTHITQDSSADSSNNYKVEMRIPDDAFDFLNRLDFIKCDVEGYETVVIPHFKETLIRFKPIVQIEIGGKENRQMLSDFFNSIDYKCHSLQNNNYIPLNTQEQILNYSGGDFYFIPKGQ